MARLVMLTKLDALLNLSPGTLRGDELLATLSNWDSLTIVEYLAMMDQDFGVILSAADLSQCQTIHDLVMLAGKPVHG